MRIINRHPGRGAALFLAALPFLALAALYATSSQERLAINPADKILPSLSQMAETMKDHTFVPDKRTGEVFVWSDTWITAFQHASSTKPTFPAGRAQDRRLPSQVDWCRSRSEPTLPDRAGYLQRSIT